MSVVFDASALIAMLKGERGAAKVAGAIADADVILFIVDARAGILPADRPFAELVRRSGKPVILASSVINSKMQDLARFVPPPTTPEEQAFDKTMKALDKARSDLEQAEMDWLELEEKKAALVGWPRLLYWNVDTCPSASVLLVTLPATS